MLWFWSSPGHRPAMRDQRGDSGLWATLQINILPAAARPGSQGKGISRLSRQCVREGGSPSSTCCTCVWSEAWQVQGHSRLGARQRQEWDLSPGRLAVGFLPSTPTYPAPPGLFTAVPLPGSAVPFIPMPLMLPRWLRHSLSAQPSYPPSLKSAPCPIPSAFSYLVLHSLQH